jgi:hypothetical protein
MDDVVFVEVCDPLKCLREKAKSLWFCEGRLGILVVEEIAVFCVLHDHVELIILHNGVPEFDDVWVIHC